MASRTLSAGKSWGYVLHVDQVATCSIEMPRIAVFRAVVLVLIPFRVDSTQYVLVPALAEVVRRAGPYCTSLYCSFFFFLRKHVLLSSATFCHDTAFLCFMGVRQYWAQKIAFFTTRTV
jgi:hypothetical protein